MAVVEVATVSVNGEGFPVSIEQPFVFGRADDAGVIGLDPADMGVSAVAGSVEWARGLWWAVNRSGKRPLLLDYGADAQQLGCGQWHAICQRRLGILVPGLIYTHRLEVVLPDADLVHFDCVLRSSGTITSDARLSDRDLNAVVALLSGYLESFPRRQTRPRTYQQAAELLGPPWTKTAVRKQIERLKVRLAASNIYFDGPQGNFELADYLIGNGMLCPDDLSRLPSRR